MTTTPSVPAGWYPSGQPGLLRWWDGTAWTEHTAPDPAAQPQPPTAYPPGQPASAAPTQGTYPLASRSGEGLFYIRVTKVTSFLVFAYQQTSAVRGTFDVCRAAQQAAQRHNLLFGWWSIPGLFWTPMALTRNKRSLELLQHAAQ